MLDARMPHALEPQSRRTMRSAGAAASGISGALAKAHEADRGVPLRDLLKRRVARLYDPPETPA